MLSSAIQERCLSPDMLYLMRICFHIMILSPCFTLRRVTVYEEFSQWKTPLEDAMSTQGEHNPSLPGNLECSKQQIQHKDLSCDCSDEIPSSMSTSTAQKQANLNQSSISHHSIADLTTIELSGNSDGCSPLPSLQNDVHQDSSSGPFLINDHDPSSVQPTQNSEISNAYQPCSIPTYTSQLVLDYTQRPHSGVDSDTQQVIASVTIPHSFGPNRGQLQLLIMRIYLLLHYKEFLVKYQLNHQICHLLQRPPVLK